MPKKYDSPVERARSAALLSILNRNGSVTPGNGDFKWLYGRLGFSKSTFLNRINYLAEQGLVVVKRSGASIRAILTDTGLKFLEEN